MSSAEWHIRAGKASDREVLAAFSCADPAHEWELEVEHFIQKQVLDEWALAPGAVDDDPRLLLGLTAKGRLFGVAAHERVVLQRGDGTGFAATKLEVVALARSWQGRRFASGDRASDVLMSAVMNDVAGRVPPRDARVFAVVHEDNHRSLALCRRHGLVQELSRADSRYRRPITAHRTASRPPSAPGAS
jgi:hypothetical protein